LKITHFKNEYRFLSNFYPCQIKHNNKIFPTAEHLYQVLKTTNLDIQENIRILKTPGAAKHTGKKVQLRKDWETVKLQIMEYVIKQKFNQNNALKNKLLSTYPAIIIEGNLWHDNYWGSCYCNYCQNISGDNNLGHILMKYRDMFYDNFI